MTVRKPLVVVSGQVEELPSGDFLDPAAFGSIASYIPTVDGAEPPAFITDGAGTLILIAYAP